MKITGRPNRIFLMEMRCSMPTAVRRCCRTHTNEFPFVSPCCYATFLQAHLRNNSTSCCTFHGLVPLDSSDLELTPE